MPFHIAYTNRAVGARQEIKGMVAENAGENSYNQSLHHEMYSALAQGTTLVETNRRMTNHLAGYFNDIGTSFEPRDLYRWIRDAYTLGFVDLLRAT